MTAGGVAVIGSEGFLGSCLVRSLDAVGIPACGYTRRQPVPPVLPATTVFFLAGSVTPATAQTQPDLVAADRALLDRVLTAVRRVGEPARLVLASSGGTVYAPDAQLPYTEQTAVGPTTVYGEAKLAMERSVLSCRWVRPVVLRLANVYGPGERATRGQGVIAHWMARLVAGGSLVLYGDPSISRDYVYIDDAVAAMLLAYRSPEGLPSVMNIGSGQATSLNRLVSLVTAAVGGCPVTVDRRPGRTVDRPYVSLSVELAESALGWRPVVPLPEGLRRTWRHVSMQAVGPAARA
jgi:UDP-glucose 4-epimerase